MPDPAALRALADRRGTIAAVLTAAITAIYFGFIALVAFDKPFMGRIVRPGLSVGVLLGALVIVAAWLLTWAYVHWANTRYDSALHDATTRDAQRGTR
jgi:uncharacterized membrane protein (DUF485 family)